MEIPFIVARHSAVPPLWMEILGVNAALMKEAFWIMDVDKSGGLCLEEYAHRGEKRKGQQQKRGQRAPVHAHARVCSAVQRASTPQY